MLNQRQLSLGFNWQLFNRFTREQNIVSASTSAETARATAEETRRAVQADLTTRLAELEAARLRIVITQRSVEASQEDLRVQQERYRLGVSTILDVLLTTEQLNQAEVDAVNARFDYLRAKANIEALIGRAL
jgi:outer membrane protein TolC